MQNLTKKIICLYLLAAVILAAMLFLPAGSLSYWQGWAYYSVILIPSFFVTFYFLGRSPEFLERRLKFQEKEARQKAIIKIANIIFFFGFLIPGFDYRFGWSKVPVWLVIIAYIVILVGYTIVFLAFKENKYAARTVEVFAGQQVVNTGPYAIIRHPMYAGVILMYGFTPLALGSYWALIAFISIVPTVILRTLNEEAVLKRDLPGYCSYCDKVRYRLVPYVW